MVSGISTGSSDEAGREAHASSGLGDKPLLVLTAGLPHPSRPEFRAEVAAYQEIWKHELQPKLARLSTRGRQVIAENAGHGIVFEAPDIVVDAIQQVVNELRRDR